ncbi:MAG: hypothetical protein ACKO43_05630 [Alphaproteobacteria bacterium]
MWWMYALLAGISLAGYLLSTGLSRADAKVLSLYRGMGAAVAFGPLAFFVTMPDDIHFYILSAVAGFVVLILDFLMFRAAQDYGAGTVGRLTPISIAFIFLGWVVYDPAYRDLMVAWPLWQTGAVIVCLVGGIVSLSAMRHDPIARNAIKISLVIAILGAFIDAASKVALDYGDLPDIGLAYMAATGVAAGITSALSYVFLMPQVKIRDAFAPSALIGGVLLLLSLAGLILFKMYAMRGVANPSYVVALICTAPLWITLYHKLTKTPDPTDLRAGFAFVICMVGLVLFSDASLSAGP